MTVQQHAAQRRPGTPTPHVRLAINIVVTVLVLISAAMTQFTTWNNPTWQWLVLPLAVGQAVTVAAIWLRHRNPVVVLGVLMLTIPLIRLLCTGLLQDQALSSLPDPLEDEAALDLWSQEVRLPAAPGSVGLLCLATVASRCRTGVAVGSFFGVLAVHGITHLVWVPREDILLSLVLVALAYVIVVLMGINVRVRRQRLTELAERNLRLALERDMREQIAVSAERTRIAREMHDVVAHSLSVMITLAEGAAATLDRDPAQARRALEQLTATGRTSLADTRRLVGVLRESSTHSLPPRSPFDAASLTDAPSPGPGPTATGADVDSLEPQPTERSVEELVQRFTEVGLPVRFLRSGPPLPQDAYLNLTIYRIVQEGLTNVLRHAPGAQRIDVTIEHRPQRISIVVENTDGTRAPTLTGSQRGLIGIRERAATYDGTVTAGPVPGGWRLDVLLRPTRP